MSSMGWSLALALLLSGLLIESQLANTRYDPNWASLGKRPLPTWFDKSKIGIFLHWGVYSVPSYEPNGAAEWFWAYWKGGNKDLQSFMKQNHPPDITYQDLAPKFTAEFYNPDQWADLFQASGARYVVLTTKHHEGYTLWPSEYSWNWNSNDVGAKRDLLGDLVNSVRNRTDLRFGTYYSLYEWYNPIYNRDKSNKFQTRDFVKNKMQPELKSLVNKYQPDLIWSDGEWDAPDTYWNSPEFLAWLYNDSPVKDEIIVNSRWAENLTWPNGCYQSKGDNGYETTLQPRKWESAITVDLKSWGFRRNALLRDYMPIQDLITKIVIIVSCGGNVIFNVGPSHDGIINPIFEERLIQMGSWLKVNGEAIYETVPWEYQNDTLTEGIWYTTNKGVVYASMLNWPEESQLVLGAIKPNPKSRVIMLGVPESGKGLPWKIKNDNLVVSLASITPNMLPNPWAWVLRFESAKPSILGDKESNQIFNM